MVGADWIAIFDAMPDDFLQCNVRDDAHFAIDDEEAEVKEVGYSFSNWSSIDVGLVSGIPDAFLHASCDKLDENNSTITIELSGLIDVVPFSETKYYANDDCDGYIEEVQSNINDIYEREVLPLLKTCKDTFIKITSKKTTDALASWYFTENEEFNNIVVKSSYCEAKADFTDYGCAEFKLNLAIFIK